MYSPDDFRGNKEEGLVYNEHSWLEIEIDGIVNANLKSLNLRVSAPDVTEMMLSRCAFHTDLSVEKDVVV